MYVYMYMDMCMYMFMHMYIFMHGAWTLWVTDDYKLGPVQLAPGLQAAEALASRVGFSGVRGGLWTGTV